MLVVLPYFTTLQRIQHILIRMQSILFGNLPPQPLVPPSPAYKLPEYNLQVPGMVFHNNRLVEIPVFDESEAKSIHSSARHTSRTSTGDFSKQEEAPEKKRKRIETAKIQILHKQPAVNAARAADMDYIDFSEPFQDFNYTSNTAYNRGAHFYDLNTYYPWTQAPNSSGTFYDDGIPSSCNLTPSFSGDTLVGDSFVSCSFAADAAEPPYRGDVDDFAAKSFAAQLGDFDHADEAYEDIKQDDPQYEFTVSNIPVDESDFAASESEEERPSKAPKLNKDGAPRKARQPRTKLLKWTDDDWKNVCLGIVWACGETGVQIPFEQAAQVVGEKCTAGALQQALLKLRGKQIAEGHQIPNLKMAWTRKNKYTTPGANAKASLEPEANRPRKKPTRVEATQVLLVTVPRAYSDQDRQGMVRPYKWRKLSRKATSRMLQNPADEKHKGPASAVTFTQARDNHDYSFAPQTPTASQGTGYFPVTPMTGHHLYESSPVTPFSYDTGYLPGLGIGSEEFVTLLTTESLDNLGSSFADASDDVFSRDDVFFT